MIQSTTINKNTATKTTTTTTSTTTTTNTTTRINCRPTGDYFLDPAEICSILLQQWGPSGQANFFFEFFFLRKFV